MPASRAPGAVPQPAVTIILRTLQPASRTRWTVQSLVRQTLEAWELILVGPGAERVFDSVQRLDPRIRRGVGAGPRWTAALNQALSSSRCPCIAFLDSNEAASADRLALQWSFLKDHPAYGLVSAGIDFLGSRGDLKRRSVVRASPDRLVALLLHENVVPFGTVMVRRECVERLGGFDEGLQEGPEHDLWLRIAGASRVAALSSVLCWHVVTGRAQATMASAPSCSDDHRRRRIEELLETHPQGAQILEAAVSAFPDDDVLWRRYSRRPDGSVRAGGPAPGGPTPVAPDLAALFVQCLRPRQEGPEPLNRLGQHYRQAGNGLLAHLCDLRSLTVDPCQQAVLDRALDQWSQGVTAPPPSPRRDSAAGSPVGPASGGPPPWPETCAVSVLMPTFNRAPRIGESIHSVLDQTFQDFELVIVDDGGTDNTADVVRAFATPQVRCVRTDHRGLAAALNTAAAHARGRYLAYLDDDDVYYPDHLARLVSLLETSGAEMAYSKSRLISGRHEDGRFRGEVDFGTYSGAYDYDALHHDCIISTLNVVHRRDCLTAVGGFDERLSRCMDWDLWVRMSERFRIAHLDAFTGEYRHHQENMNAATFAQGEALTDLLRNYFTSCRGLAVLFWAAHLQGRGGDRERILSALEGTRLTLRPEMYDHLLAILPRVPHGPRLIERLFVGHPTWYLRLLVSRCREHRWSALGDVPAALYPRLIGVGSRHCGALVGRYWRALRAGRSEPPYVAGP